MRYKIFLDKKFQKQLEKMDKNHSKLIKNRLIKLKNGFDPTLDIKKLKGYKNYYRLRVGDYRILFELQKDRIIIVFALLPRKSAYK